MVAIAKCHWYQLKKSIFVYFKVLNKYVKSIIVSNILIWRIKLHNCIYWYFNPFINQKILCLNDLRNSTSSVSLVYTGAGVGSDAEKIYYLWIFIAVVDICHNKNMVGFYISHEKMCLHKFLTYNNSVNVWKLNT